MTRSTSRLDRTRDGVHIIGDSIAYNAHSLNGSPLQVAKRPDHWTVDNVPGRRLTAMNNPLVAKTSDYGTSVTHMFTVGPLDVCPTPADRRIETIVIALGTNDHWPETLTWYEAAQMYGKGINMLWGVDMWVIGRPKMVVLVTPWRDPSMEAPDHHQTHWASRSAINRQAIEYVAANTSTVSIMDWAGYAAAHPERFPDGVHPDAAGLVMWRDMLMGAITDCETA